MDVKRKVFNMKIKTLGELLDYVGNAPFEVINGNYKAQFVTVDNTIYLLYWTTTVNPPFKRIKMDIVSGREDTIVDLEVRKLNKVDPINMREATPEERESVYKYVQSISLPTGITFDEIDEKANMADEFVEYAKTNFGADVIIKPAKKTSDTFEDLFGIIDEGES